MKKEEIPFLENDPLDQDTNHFQENFPSTPHFEEHKNSSPRYFEDSSNNSFNSNYFDDGISTDNSPFLL